MAEKQLQRREGPLQRRKRKEEERELSAKARAYDEEEESNYLKYKKRVAGLPPVEEVLAEDAYTPGYGDPPYETGDWRKSSYKYKNPGVSGSKISQASETFFPQLPEKETHEAYWPGREAPWRPGEYEPPPGTLEGERRFDFDTDEAQKDLLAINKAAIGLNKESLAAYHAKQIQALGAISRSKFSDIPEDLRPNYGFFDPNYMSILFDRSSELTSDQFNRLKSEYERFQRTPLGRELQLGLETQRYKGKTYREFQEPQAQDDLLMSLENEKTALSRDERLDVEEQQHQKFVHATREEMKKRIEEADNAIEELRSTHGGKVDSEGMLALAIIGGLLGGGKVGNAVGSIINAQMQKYQLDLQRAQGVVKGKENILGMMQESLGDEKVAYLATRQAIIDDVNRELELRSMGSTSRKMKRELDVKRYQLAEESRLNARKMQVELYRQSTEEGKRRAAAAAAGAIARKKQQRWDKLASEGYERLGKDERVLVGGPDFGDWIVPKMIDKVQYRELQKRVSSTGETINTADSLINDLNENGFPATPRDILRIKQKARMLLSAVIRERGANLTKLEVNLLQDMAGGGAENLSSHLINYIQNGTIQDGIRRFAKWEADKAKSAIAVGGGRRVMLRRVRDDDGNIIYVKQEQPESFVEQKPSREVDFVSSE